MEYNKLIKYLKGDFVELLNNDFNNGALYSEAELQCILYKQLRYHYDYIYPETWYGNHRADLCILNKSLGSFRKEDNKNIKNLSFNLAYYSKPDFFCDVIIELKYGYNINMLKNQLWWDIDALKKEESSKKHSIKNKGEWYKNIKHRLLIYVLDISYKNEEKKEKILKEKYKLREIQCSGVDIIGYIWDGEKLKLIED